MKEKILLLKFSKKRFLVNDIWAIATPECYSGCGG